MIENFTAEQSLLGSIFLGGNETMAAIQTLIEPRDFLAEENKTVYKACLKLYREEKPIDAVSVLNIAGEEYKKLIITTAQIVPSPSHATEYARIVRETAQKARAYNLTSGFLEALQGNTEAKKCQLLAENILKCFNEPLQDDTVNAEEMYLSFCDRQDHPKEYIHTGFATLDKYTYIEHGDYIIVGGEPSAGKTAFTLQLLRNISRDYTCVYFSLETNNDKLGDRMIGNFNNVPLPKIKSNSLTDEEWQRVSNGYTEFKKLRFFSVRASGYSVDQIQAKALQLHADVIFVDYVGLVEQKAKSATEQAEAISKGLHTLAQKNKITVFALSQLSREGIKTSDMHSLKNSSQFEQDADTIFLIQYDEEKPEERILKIVKNKEGRRGKIKLGFKPEIQRFSEVDTQYDEA